MQKEYTISTFRVAATYIGTVVGAGFASGQEVLQFFAYHGLVGFWGIVLGGLLFSFFGLIILKLGRKLRADSHLPVIHEVGGKWLGIFIDFVITFFLFGALVAMIAGAGSIFKEQLGLPPILGNILMAIAALITVLGGIHRVITAISMVVPLLLIAVLGISFASLYQIGFNLDALRWANPDQAAVPFWPLAAINYVSYNLVIAIAVLAPLGKEAKDPSVLTKGAIYGGLGLGVGAIAIFLSLLATPEATRFDVPMTYIASRFSPIVVILYTGVLFLEVYTTAVGNLYGFAVRMVSPEHNGYKVIVAGTTLAGLLFSQFGFTTLVRFLYPTVGYAGLLMLGGLTWIVLRSRFMLLTPAPVTKPLPEKDKDKREK